jgi:TetR/AcrR family transcriptional regulator of autoinduction and epiphytic fitness
MRTGTLRSERERQRREEYRVEILQAAEAVITRRGYAAATMDDIAKESEVAKATLYKYFPSKGELVFEILMHFFDDVAARLTAIRSERTSGREKLRRAIRMIVDFHEEKANISGILLMESGVLDIFRAFVVGQGKTGSPADRTFLEAMRRKRLEIFELGAGILEEGIASGEFRSLDIRSALTFIDAALQGFVHNRMWLGREQDAAGAAAMLFDFIMKGVGKQIKPTKET